MMIWGISRLNHPLTHSSTLLHMESVALVITKSLEVMTYIVFT